MGGRALYHRITDEIIALIDSGTYEPESRLPAERELAKKFDVSRAVVREALIALHAKGVIEIKVGSGAYILKKSKYGLYGLPKFGPLELVEARALIEAEAAALAAPVITEEDILKLESYVEIMSGREESDMAPMQADAAFHHTIARATNNKVMILVIESMWTMRTETNLLKKIYNKIQEEGRDEIEYDHQAILAALKARNASAARNAMRAHFSRLIEALLTASEEEAYEEIKRKAAEHRSRFLSNA